MMEFQYNLATLADSGPNGHFKLTNSPQYPKRSIYQPGGVACGFDASMKMRFLREGIGSFRRWIWQEFGHCSMVTRVCTIYRVNDGSEQTSGTSTAWYQQRCLYEIQGQRVNPRKQVIEDLCNELRTWIDKGNNVILGGDFNERIYSKESLSEKWKI